MGVPDGSLGIAQSNIAQGSLLSLKQETLHYIAQNTTFIVNNADISSSSVGDTLTLAAGASDVILPVPDFVIVTPTDNDAATMTVSVLVTGNRMGKKVSEEISVTGDTAATGTVLFDEVTEVKITAISGNAASDLLDVGFSATAAGTRLGIFDNLNHVKCAIHHRQQGNVNVLDTLDATSINAGESAFLWAGLATSVAAGDTVTLLYYAKGDLDGWHQNDRWSNS